MTRPIVAEPLRATGNDYRRQGIANTLASSLLDMEKPHPFSVTCFEMNTIEI